MIQLDPDIAAAFTKSTSISSKYRIITNHFLWFLTHHLLYNAAQKGISANLCKIGSKRRRTHQELIEEKKENQRKDQEIQEKLVKFQEMEAKVNELQSQLNNNQTAANILSEMVS